MKRHIELSIDRIGRKSTGYGFRAPIGQGVIIAILMVIQPVLFSFGQWPSESEIPGGIRKTPPSGESEIPVLALPNRYSLKLPSDPPVKPGNQEVVTPFPSESKLPVKLTAIPKGTPGRLVLQEPDEIGKSRDKTPWLRLTEAEHTGLIRTVRFDKSGENLFTAGEDKIVHQWKLADDKKKWHHVFTYRWQVGRAEQGKIFCMAANDSTLAIAGAGAEGEVGEIGLFDKTTGRCLGALKDKDIGHLSKVLGVEWMGDDPNRPKLVSLDDRGMVCLWEQKADLTWSPPRHLREPEKSENSRIPFAKVDNNHFAIGGLARNGGLAENLSLDVVSIVDGQITQKYELGSLPPEGDPIWNLAVEHIEYASDQKQEAELKMQLQAKLDMQPNATSKKQLELTLKKQLEATMKKYREERKLNSRKNRMDNVANIKAIIGESRLISACFDKVKKMVIASDSKNWVYAWGSNGKLVFLYRRFPVDGDNFDFNDFAFYPSGSKLAMAANNANKKGSRIEIWNAPLNSIPTFEKKYDVPSSVMSIDLSENGQWLAFGAGRDVRLARVDQNSAPMTLPSRHFISSIRSVAFATQLPYRWKVDMEADQSLAFDGQRMQLLESNNIAWNSPSVGETIESWQQGNWRIAIVPRSKPVRYQITTRNTSKDPLIPSDVPDRFIDQDLKISSLKFLGEWKLPGAVSGANRPVSDPVGIAISLVEHSAILVYRLPGAGQSKCELVRIFESHEDAVRSIDVSPDQHYLISAGSDCTIRIHSLVGLFEREKPKDARIRWGFDFVVENDKVIASNNPFPLGPLNMKGLREGDEIKSLAWKRGLANGKTETVRIEGTDEIAAFLANPTFNRAVAFYTSRLGVDREGFQSYPHWREVVAQVINRDRDWAVWTPAGYYTSSAEGATLFGWQLNRGLGQNPDFYRADRFRELLDRPDVMRNLLASGSIEETIAQASPSDRPTQRALSDALQLTPQVSITKPSRDAELRDGMTTIKANITIKSGQVLRTPKAFVNGVIATERRQNSVKETDQGDRTYEFQWQSYLPSDKRLRIDVLAPCEEQTVGSDQVFVTQEVVTKPTNKKARLFVVAAGINKYQDSSLTELDQAAGSTKKLLDALQSRAAALYVVHPLSRIDQDVTRSLWRSLLDEVRESLRPDVRPDDVLIIFLSGHGVRDKETGEYYFVTQNARLRDIEDRNYRDCLSFRELTNWSDLSCRKIVILDTCHSGAIETLDPTQLRSAIQYCQGDMVLTLTASEGNQLASEYKGDQASLFTKTIVDALERGIDENQDGDIEWKELARQTREKVVSESSIRARAPQFPTAGPRELLELVRIPIAKAENLTPRATSAK